MASTPNYDGTRRYGSLILNNAAGTTLSAAVLTGASSGTRVRELHVSTGPTTTPGSGVKLAVVIDDGVNQTVIDVITIQNLADWKHTLRTYDNVHLPAATVSLKFQLRSSVTAGATVHVAVFGSDF